MCRFTMCESRQYGRGGGRGRGAERGRAENEGASSAKESF